MKQLRLDIERELRETLPKKMKGEIELQIKSEFEGRFVRHKNSRLY